MEENTDIRLTKQEPKISTCLGCGQDFDTKEDLAAHYEDYPRHRVKESKASFSGTSSNSDWIDYSDSVRTFSRIDGDSADISIEFDDMIEMIYVKNNGTIVDTLDTTDYDIDKVRWQFVEPFVLIEACLK